MSIAGIKSVTREILGDSKGVISWGHVASSVTLLAAIVWVSHIVIKTHALPALDGITGFIVGPYAANKAATAVQAFSQNPVATAAPPSMPPAPDSSSTVVPPPMAPPAMASPPTGQTGV